MISVHTAAGGHPDPILRWHKDLWIRLNVTDNGCGKKQTDTKPWRKWTRVIIILLCSCCIFQLMWCWCCCVSRQKVSNYMALYDKGCVCQQRRLGAFKCTYLNCKLHMYSCLSWKSNSSIVVSTGSIFESKVELNRVFGESWHSEPLNRQSSIIKMFLHLWTFCSFTQTPLSFFSHCYHNEDKLYKL